MTTEMDWTGTIVWYNCGRWNCFIVECYDMYKNGLNAGVKVNQEGGQALLQYKFIPK